MKLRTNMKTITLFGRAIPMTLIVALMVVGIGSAALIASYFVVKSTVNVEQPVSITDVAKTYTCDGDAGTVCVYPLVIANTGNDAVLMELATTGDPAIKVEYRINNELLPDVDVDKLEDLVVPPGGVTMEIIMHILTGAETGVYTITTTATSPDGVNILNLDNKDVDWKRTNGDGIGGFVIYTPEGTPFNFYSKANVLVDGDYNLIYYADKPDRFVDWGGDNPGLLIGTGTATGGKLKMEGSEPLGMDLPAPQDANNEIDYGRAPDYYLTPHGAKLWIVPSSDYFEQGLTAWNPSAYLFETDLISYTQIP